MENVFELGILEKIKWMKTLDQRLSRNHHHHNHHHYHHHHHHHYHHYHHWYLLGEEHEEMVVIAALEDRLGCVCVELNHLNIQKIVLHFF